MNGHLGNVNGVSLAPDGRRGASAGSDGTVRLWDVESGKEVRRLTGHKGTVWCVAFAPDGVVLSGGADGTGRLWEAATGELRRLCGHSSLVLSVAFAADGRRLATGSGQDGAVVGRRGAVILALRRSHSVLAHSGWSGLAPSGIFDSARQQPVR